ncbi:MAG: protein kinase [Candidatus Eremiobacteraeota bacterium]|nr:protein kinase [Candidatus Eremiobacteraeota bacterium]
MRTRVQAPDGKKTKEGTPVMVLPDGTALQNGHTLSYLAAGGMCVAYRGVKGGKEYFVKEVDGTVSRHVLALSQEKSTLERLRHPGIIKIHDFFEEEGYYYLVSEFIEGKSLDRLVPENKEVFLKESTVLAWAEELITIFEYLHSQSPPIIYRDLKPQNIILDLNEHIHLVDFGIARVYKDRDSRSGDTIPMGTALTASPEHYGGRQTDERSDIYTLGATLHFLATNGWNFGEGLFEFVPVRTINTALSENFEKVIEKALEVLPEDRFQTMREMRTALTHPELKQSTSPAHKKADTPITTETLRGVQTLTPAGESSRAQKVLTPLSLTGIALVCLILLISALFAVKIIVIPRGVSNAVTMAPESTALPSVSPEISSKPSQQAAATSPFTPLPLSAEATTKASPIPSEALTKKNHKSTDKKRPVQPRVTVTKTVAYVAEPAPTQALPPLPETISYPRFTTPFQQQSREVPAYRQKQEEKPWKQRRQEQPLSHKNHPGEGPLYTFRGCQMSIPRNFQEMKSTPPEFVKMNLMTGTAEAYIHVRFLESKDMPALSKWGERLKEKTGARNVENSGNMKLNGYDALSFRFVTAAPNNPSQLFLSKQVIISCGDRTYVLTVGAVKEKLQEISPEFNKFFNSFKIVQ